MEDLTKAVAKLEVSVPEPIAEENLTKTFKPFPRLPRELQLQIWETARPEPRAVKLIIAKKYHEYQAGYSRIRNVTSRARVPTLLHTCKTSRQVALKWYTQSFGWCKDFADSQKNHGPGGIYFDWSRDWVYLRCSKCKDHFDYPGQESVDCCISVLASIPFFDLTRVIFEGRNLSWPIFLSQCGAIPNAEQVLVIHPDDGLQSEHEVEMAEFQITETDLPPKRPGKSLTESVAILKATLMAMAQARMVTTTLYGDKIEKFDVCFLDRLERRFQREWRDVVIDFNFRGGHDTVGRRRRGGGRSIFAKARGKGGRH